MNSRSIGRFFLTCFGNLGRCRNKALSLLIAGAFAKFGKNSVLMHPVRLFGVDRIEIGNGVCIGSNSWLQALPDDDCERVALVIGDRSSSAGMLVLSAVRSLTIEEDVLIARNVYISDHSHRFVDPHLPVHAQGLSRIAPVRICRGAWLCQNVVVCSGVTIGVNSIVGANSVVKSDIPDHCVAVGAPARVVKHLEPIA